MIISLRSADGAVISVEQSLLRESGYITGAVEDLAKGATSEPFDVPYANEYVLRLVLHCTRKCTQQSFSLEDAEAEFRSNFPLPHRDTEGSIYLKQPIWNEILATAEYLAMSNLLRLGCQTVADMIRGRSPMDVRMRLSLGSHQTAESSRIDFPALSKNLRVMCYDCFAASPEIIMTFCQATQTEDGNHNLFSEFHDWTKGLLAITSPYRDYLSQLAPNNEVVMYNYYNRDAILTNVDERSREKGDHIYAESWWRPTQASMRELRALSIGPIEVESVASSIEKVRYLVICRRKELEKFSRNWIMFWPITALEVLPHGHIWDMDGALSLFEGVKPEINTLLCNEKREYKRSGFLTNEEIFAFLQRIENQEWSGYPAQICLEQSLALIDSIFKWHDVPWYGYYSRSRLERTLSDDHRRALEEVRARLENVKDQVKLLKL